MIAYDGNQPGVTGVHYGRDGIGVLGSDLLIETASGDNGAGIIQQSTDVDPTAEYRLQIISGFTGFSVNENGSGSATVSGVATMKLFKNGVEL